MLSPLRSSDEFRCDLAEKRRFPNRIPLSLEVSSLAVLVISLIFILFGFILLKWQKNTLYLEKVETSKTILDQFANSAKIPLLADETLVLNRLVTHMSNIEGLLYAIIVDRKGIIKAHTESTKTGRSYQSPEANINEAIETKGDIQYLIYASPDGYRILHISKPIIFKSKDLGSAHLGFSLDFIHSWIEKKITVFLRAILPLSFVAVLFVIGLSVLLTRSFTRHISQLILAIQEFGRGNLSYNIKSIHRSELGDLALALNDMSQQLQEKFSAGKYLPTQIEPFDGKLGYLGGFSPPSIMRSQVTVVFAGIRGFKQYTKKKDANSVLQDLNEYFTLTHKTIVEHGGYVDKFIGDAVIAVFGVSPLHRDHAERAVKCAVALQEVLRDPKNHGNLLLKKIGIGISSGVVVSGKMGSDDKMTYAFIGESFRVAYSLNVMARPGEIVISKDVYQLIKDLFSVEPIPPREMIDKSEAWESFRLQAVGEKKKHD